MYATRYFGLGFSHLDIPIRDVLHPDISDMFVPVPGRFGHVSFATDNILDRNILVRNVRIRNVLMLTFQVQNAQGRYVSVRNVRVRNEWARNFHIWNVRVRNVQARNVRVFVELGLKWSDAKHSGPKRSGFNFLHFFYILRCNAKCRNVLVLHFALLINSKCKIFAFCIGIANAKWNNI